MSTLAEIERAAEALPIEQQQSLYQWLSERLRARQNGARHSVLDIPTVSVGKVLRPLSREDDLLGEMLEERV